MCENSSSQMTSKWGKWGAIKKVSMKEEFDTLYGWKGGLVTDILRLEGNRASFLLLMCGSTRRVIQVWAPDGVLLVMWAYYWSDMHKQWWPKAIGLWSPPPLHLWIGEVKKERGKMNWAWELGQLAHLIRAPFKKYLPFTPTFQVFPQVSPYLIVWNSLA